MDQDRHGTDMGQDRTDTGQDGHRTGRTPDRTDTGQDGHGAGQDRGQAGGAGQGTQVSSDLGPPGAPSRGGPGAHAPASCPLSLPRATVEARAPLSMVGQGFQGSWRLWGDPPRSLSCSLTSCLKGPRVPWLQLQEVMMGQNQKNLSCFPETLLENPFFFLP